jgi:phosphomevalonate kinase
MRRYIAPGKVVLMGEYAVLDGAPALVLAVDRGVACEVHPADRVVIEALDTRFVGPALEGAAPGLYRFSAHNPPNTPTKVGLGTSAAATVVATLAGRPSLGRGELFSRALAVHRAVQGSGSGIDVAASTYGGVLRYQAQEATQVSVSIEPLVVYSGGAASTAERVARYLAWSPRAEFVAESTAVVAGFAADPIGSLERARLLLERMAAAARLRYRTPALDRIGVLARRFGGAAKPSGAGGGDCAVALFPDVEARLAFAAAAAADNLPVIPVSTAHGAHQEP